MKWHLRSVPEQVAVLGMGNDPLICDCASVPLSSVDSNRFAQGRIAAELLDRLMNGEAVPAEFVVTPSGGVVARKSTDVLAVPDLDTARALRYLWEHLAEPLSVGKVAKAVGVSRRTLDRAFRTHLGRSVTDELNRKRIERCCELLTGTRQSVVSIARQVLCYCSLHASFTPFRSARNSPPSACGAFLAFNRTHRASWNGGSITAPSRVMNTTRPRRIRASTEMNPWPKTSCHCSIVRRMSALKGRQETRQLSGPSE